jgi:CheY-like chemotaxis protein
MDRNPPPSAEQTLILIVEDSLAQAKYLQRSLDSWLIETAITSNGVEALDFMASRMPALIISDVVMPVMDGYALCKQIKASPRFGRVPFMLLTQLSHPADIFKGLESGADYYNLKPFDVDKLRERVAAILRAIKSPPEVLPEPPFDLNFAYGGQAYPVRAGRSQILDLLLATFEDIVVKNQRLEEANRKLSEARQDNKTLRGLIPICSYCKQVRDDRGYWDQVESYISKHFEADFSHGICPRCFSKYAQDSDPKSASPVPPDGDSPAI